MDKRNKILVAAFGVLIGYALLAGVVYPRWIKPLLTLDERIAERQKDLDKLLAEDAQVENARLEYKSLVGRVGSFDALKVETKLRERLNHLIEKHKLTDSAITPSRPVEDRKTGLTTSTISVSATGTLDGAVGFLKDVAELPDLVRVGNASLSPAGGGRKASEKDQRINLRVPLDVWVLPRNRVAGALQPEELTSPQTVARHASQDYSTIVAAKPFWPWVPPIPLRVTIARPINVEKGAQAILEGTASGGDGEYTILWSPSEGLSDPRSLRPTVDTSNVGNTNYTLTVTDGTGGIASASTTVVVREPAPPPQVVEKERPAPPPPPPVKTRQPWPDARNKEIKMALLRTLGDEQLDEFMVYDTKTRQESYYKVGDPFDGGTLVYVHQLGGVMRWEDEYYVYPLGVTLDQVVEAGAATEYPELQLAADRIREALTKPPPAEVKPESPGAEAPGPAAPDVGKPEEKMPAAEAGLTQQPPDAPQTPADANAEKPAATANPPAQGEGAPAATAPAQPPAEAAPGPAPETPPGNTTPSKPSRTRTVKPGVRKPP